MPLNTTTADRNEIPLTGLKSVSGKWEYEVKIGDVVDLEALSWRQSVCFHSRGKYLLITYVVQNASDAEFCRDRDDWSVFDIEGVKK